MIFPRTSLHFKLVPVQHREYEYGPLVQSTIGHFRVTLCLCFKTSLRAQAFIWKWVWFARNWTCRRRHIFAVRLVLALRQEAILKWPIPSMRCARRESWKLYSSFKACSNALDFVYHTTFDLYTLQSRVRLNTLYSAHYTRFDKSNRVKRCLKLVKLILDNHSTFPLFRDHWSDTLQSRARLNAPLDL